MVGKKQKSYSDYQLCKDIARAELTRSEIARKHNISEGMVGQITRGDSRPELRRIVDQLVDSAVGEARRMFRSKGRWFAERLLHLAADDHHPEVTLRAICRGLELREAFRTVLS